LNAECGNQPYKKLFSHTNLYFVNISILNSMIFHRLEKLSKTKVRFGAKNYVVIALKNDID